MTAEPLGSRVLDITTLAPDKWAPVLKARLVGDASMYKPLLDRESLRDPNDGVDYFKNELRPHFAKGVEAVFFFQILLVATFFVQRLTRPPKMDMNITGPPKAHH